MTVPVEGDAPVGAYLITPAEQTEAEVAVYVAWKWVCIERVFY